MRYKYYIVQSPEGFINMEPSDSEEWLQWLFDHGYALVGTAESHLHFRQLERGIARSYFNEISK